MRKKLEIHLKNVWKYVTIMIEIVYSAYDWRKDSRCAFSRNAAKYNSQNLIWLREESTIYDSFAAQLWESGSGLENPEGKEEQTVSNRFPEVKIWKEY